MSRRVRLLQRSKTLVCLLVLGCTSAFAGTSNPWSYIDLDGHEHSFAAVETCDNVLTGGTIGSDVTGCANPTFQAPTLTSFSLPTGGTGNLEFAWMTTTVDPASGQAVSWQIMPNTNSPNYTPSPLASTAYYMRCARREGCTEYGGESNYVTVTIDCCDNATAGGTIAGDQTNCGVPFDPSLLTNVAPASGGRLAMRYEWLVSTTTDVYTPGSAAWTVATSVTTPYFNPGPVSQVTYYVRTARREFCSEVGAFSNVVTINAHPVPSIKSDVTEVSCAGLTDGTANITILNAAAPFTSRWLDNNSTDVNRTGLAAGTYQFEISDANGCTALEEVVVSEPAELNANIAATVDNCAFNNDAALTATPTGGTEPYAYAWNTGATTATITNLSAGSYSVTVTDANGCVVTATETINPPPALTASASTVQPVCYANNGEISISANGGATPYTYAWTPNVTTSNTATGLPGGNYSVVVTDANSCTTAVDVFLDNSSAIEITLTPQLISCNGEADGAISSFVQGGVGVYTYAWTANGAAFSTAANLNNLGPAVYELTVTDQNGCTEVAQVDLVEPRAIVADITVTQIVCNEDGGGLMAAISGGTAPYTFDWGAYGNNNFETLTGVPSGNYTLNVTDARGCTAMSTATITTTDLMVLSVSSTRASCPGEADGSATVDIVGGEAPYTIVWDGDVTQNTRTLGSLRGDTYQVAVTDARGCEKTAVVTVSNLSTGPIVSGEVTDLTCFGATTGAIDLSVTGGLGPHTYTWDNGLPNTEDQTGLAAGVYNVTVTDAAGCEAEQTYTITAPDELICTAEATSSFLNYFNVSRYDAADGTALVTTSGGNAPYTYAWSNGAVGANATRLIGGINTVVVTDASGCTCSTDVDLEEPSMISDRVFKDDDGDGIQDATETGLAGISITLSGQDFNGLPINFNQTTDANGNYKFDQLPMGSYFMIFQNPNLADFLLSPRDQGGDDALDSDMDPSTGAIQRTVTAHGNGDFDTDAGYIPRENVITLGDRVWYDEDHDGIQDAFELNLQGVTVNLIRSADDFLVNSTRTNEDGNYAFTDVAPGTYHVTIDQTTSTVASTFVFTTPKVGMDDNLDSDLDPVTMRSADITVMPGTADINFVDIGLHEACGTLSEEGEIAGNESVCRGTTPAPVTSVSVPSGALAYRWIRSATPTYRGSGDPNWSAIPGATQADYQPGGIVSTVHYIRLVRDAACSDFTSESNVITKQVSPLPTADISTAANTFCMSQPMNVSASGAGASTVLWDFGVDATPQFASTADVAGVTFSAAGTRFIHLSVTNAEGCVGRDSLQINTLNCFGPGDISGLQASTNDGQTTLNWRAISLFEGSYFDIERRLEGEAYEVLQSIDCTATGSWYDYSFVDKFAPSGVTNYRIVHRAPAASDAESQYVELTVAQHSLDLKAFPNPMGSELTVEVAVAERGQVSYQLINAFGATVSTDQLVGGRHTLQTSGLPAGTYYLRIITPSGLAETRTLVKY